MYSTYKKMLKLEATFLEAFDLFKRSLIEDSSSKYISFEEVYSSDPVNEHYFMIKVNNINFEYLSDVLATKFSSKEDAIQTGIEILINYVISQCDIQTKTPADEQGWMPESVTYWYKLKSEAMAYKTKLEQ
jgi:hypothetical protein